MAEAPTTAWPGPAGCARDVLLATKLHVPRPQPGFVPRPRLTAALDEGLARRLILVCAPAGFGKTALLAGWASVPMTSRLTSGSPNTWRWPGYCSAKTAPPRHSGC
jgi:hypothetical protein